MSEGPIERPNVEPCDKLEVVKVTYLNSRRCVTVSCPEGTFGESVEVCVDAGTFTSDQSQDEANARADALAYQMAIAQLHCSPEPVLEDRGTLNIEMEGDYSISAVIDQARLALTMTGDYEISDLIELATLVLEMVGEYKLEPLVDTGRLAVTLSPISENRLPGLNENASMTWSAHGAYQLATVLLNTLTDNSTLTATMRGAYASPITTVTAAENASIGALLRSGNYVLVVTQVTQAEAASIGLNTQSGLYLLRTVAVPPPSERSSLSVTLRGGTYA